MPEAPPSSQACSRSSVSSLGGNERGDGNEVVGIGRMPQAEQESDAQRDEERRACKQALEPGIQLLDRLEEKVKAHVSDPLTALSSEPVLPKQDGQRPTIGKWRNRASQPMWSRTASRIGASLSSRIVSCLPQISQTM